MRSRWKIFGIGGIMGWATIQLQAQIYYNRPTGPNQAFQLWQMDPSGANERIVALNLPEPVIPKWSPDGKLLALSSSTPGRPNKLSWDIFTLDPTTGKTTSVVAFQDEVKTVDLPQGGTELRSGFSLPVYKALSPDQAQIAIWQFVRVAVTQNGTPTGTSTTPVLQVYRTADGLLESTQVLNRQLTGLTTGGVGVDWHPTQNLLAAAIDVDVSAGAAGVTEGCAIFLLEPVQDPLHSGKGHQLTHPTGFLTSNLFGTANGGQSDYAPAFSPNGQEVAYFRCLTVLDSNTLGYRRPCEVSLRLIGTDGSNDREILGFQVGIFPTQVCWSPDGQQLVFDSGSQLMVGGGPANAADPQTTRISTIHRDGTGVHSLTETGRSSPAWRPGTLIVNPPTGNVGRLEPHVFGNGQVQLTVNGLPAGKKARVDTTGDLNNWVPLQTLTGTGNPISLVDPGSAGQKARFYRILGVQ